MAYSSPIDVAILGAGSIGVAFAVVFARAGAGVRLFDPEPAARAAAPAAVARRLADLRNAGLLDEPPDRVLARVGVVATLAAAVAAADYVQECAPERLDLKRALLAAADAAAPPATVIASASSFMPASETCGHLPGRQRALVAHPGNPPFLIPVVEIVPAPFTGEETVRRAVAVLAAAGLAPVRLRREIHGFVFNRLQGALLREAYRLVRDGVATVADIDTVVRDGLGLRWAVTGPFETADLNTRGGIAAHAERMGPHYARMGAERGESDSWTADLVKGVVAERRRHLPLDRWEERVAWRDRRLMRLVGCLRRERDSDG